MSFQLPKYTPPPFTEEPFTKAPEVSTEDVKTDGIAPENYHATTIYPEYFKVQGKWILAKESRMDCVPVLRNLEKVEILEFRNLKKGDIVILGRTEDGSEGIYVDYEAFKRGREEEQAFSFRAGRSRETSYSRDYDKLYNLLKYEKEHGYIVWVLGPAVAFDHDSKRAFSSLIENGYVDALLAGNAMATHDLEGSVLGTALGQDIYTLKSAYNSHYNHIDIINRARKEGSIEKFMEKEGIKDGIVYSCMKHKIPLVLAGSIRDDGPLPGVYGNVYEAQNAMREHTRKATTVICLATQLHTIATGNMTPMFRVIEDHIRPVYIYTVDISEFVLNKLSDRGSLEATSIVTNIQDFLVNLAHNLQ